MMLNKNKHKIENYAISQYPKECCGFLIKCADSEKEEFFPFDNSHSDPLNNFAISAQHFAEAEEKGELLAIIHSHTKTSAKASELDLVSCEEFGLPWHIVAIGKNPEEEMPKVLDWSYIEPNGYKAPLVGRSFFHGTLDCFGLIKDFYERELWIKLNNPERPDNWWKDEKIGELYLNNVEKWGFEIVNDGPKYGDVILMQYRSDRANHGGVYLGNEILKTEPHLHKIPFAMLHHVQGRLSDRVVYSGFWKDITRVIARHKDLK